MVVGGSSRSRWGSRLGFILGAAGSAIGLGNIWKFPYITGMNGGGAFVLVYLLCIILIATPLLIVETVIGRTSQRSPIEAFRQLRGKRSPWQIVGWSLVIFAFVLLSYYSVVAGWSMDYLFKSLTGAFAGKDPDTINGLFGQLYTNPGLNILWHSLFMVAVVAIILGGVQKGIERWSKILMAILLALIVVLVIRGLTSSGAMAGVMFVFRPDFAKLTPAAILEALGHAFFTLSLGMGTMLTYGSYLSDKTNVPRSSLWVASLDTFIAIMACLMIFPIVFAFGFETTGGPGLVFKTLPVAFSKMAFGHFFAALFFFLLFFAALTSGISVLEVVVRACMDGFGWTRKKSTLIMAGSVCLFGMLSALSGSLLSHIKWLGGRNLFDSFDYLVSNWAMPLNGLAMALFVGWVLNKTTRQQEFLKGQQNTPGFAMWNAIIRYLVPIAMVAVFLQVSGLWKW